LVHVLDYNRDNIITSPISDSNLGAKFIFNSVAFDIWSADTHLPLRNQILPFIRKGDPIQKQTDLALQRLRRVRGSVFPKVDDVSIILNCTRFNQFKITPIIEGRGWSETCNTQRIEPMSKYFLRYPNLEKQFIKVFNVIKKSTHFSDPTQKLTADSTFLSQMYSLCDPHILSQELQDKDIDALEFDTFVSSVNGGQKTP